MLPGTGHHAAPPMIPSPDETFPTARSAATAFLSDQEILRLLPWGSGHIHQTFRVETNQRCFLLQRLNEHVFPDLDAVMQNLERISAHLASRLSHLPDGERRLLRLLTTLSQSSLHRDTRGNAWRMLHFIPGTVSFDTAVDLRQIEAAARAFGEFQRRLDELPGPPLRETIPGFHDTRRRFARFEQVLNTDPLNRRQTCEDEIRSLLTLRHLASALQDLRLPPRTVHNDTKLNNLLFDQASQEPLCVIDWDTVMPGHVAHDFGDLVRTMASEAAEDEPDISRVKLRPDRLAALQAGYLSATQDWLAPAEVESLRLGAETILYEQALRFLTDHLEGDHYYPVSQPGHNLLRARVQITLLSQLRLLPPP